MTANRSIEQPALGPRALALIVSLEQFDDYYGLVLGVVAEAVENAQAKSGVGDLTDLVAELTSSDVLPTLRLPLSFSAGPSGAHIWQADGDGLDAEGADLICRAINTLAGLAPTGATPEPSRTPIMTTPAPI